MVSCTLTVSRFVSAIRYEDSSPTVLRSSKSGNLLNRLYNYCTIWQAARATSAASTFFDPITIGPNNQKFVDGGLRNNNPVNLVERESQNLWPNDDRLILSIGTGDAPGGNFEGNLKTVVYRLKEIALDSEHVADTFTENHLSMLQAQRLFRFTVPGLAEIGLEETNKERRLFLAPRAILNVPTSVVASLGCIEGLGLPGSRVLMSTEEQ